MVLLTPGRPAHECVRTPGLRPRSPPKWKENRYAKPILSVPAPLSSTHRARLAPLSRARDLPTPNLATPLSRSRPSPCPFPPLPMQRLTLPPTCTGSARHQPRLRPPTPSIRPLLAHPYTPPTTNCPPLRMHRGRGAREREQQGGWEARGLTESHRNHPHSGVMEGAVGADGEEGGRGARW
ncbi:hypothetical protein BDA96_05G129900 [Sorghum bicolor]|uniref:Uncharacterized protein n=1 Tax=Sorghum bicolor TaxID=4558 RepID=A0A921QXM3_SORBI|nr:hypothetical protein BDA96_05G129900 [Sorghum bicolor]